MKKLLMLFALLALTGCADQILNNQRSQLAGYPEPYKDGYTDGCSSGTKAAGNPYFTFKKDVMRFSSDKLYSQGWTDGFNVCKSDYESTMRMLSH